MNPPSRTCLTSLLLALGIATPARAQSPTRTDITSSYSLTKTGWGSADRITDPGTIYVIHTDGLLARAIADHITPTNTFIDGKLVPPAKGFRGAFGASGDVRQVEPGQRFYLHDVEAKDDAFVFTLLSLDSVGIVSQGGSTRSRARLYVRFPMSKQELAKITPEAVHHLTDPVFTPENAPTQTVTVQLGQDDAEVHQLMGNPDKVIDLGPKKILIYKSLKITMVDGKVTDAE